MVVTIGSVRRNLSTSVVTERLRPITLRQITRRKEKAEEREKETENKVKTRRTKIAGYKASTRERKSKKGIKKERKCYEHAKLSG